METYIICKHPEPFQPDHVFRVPEALSSLYVNMNFKHAKTWYEQIYPVKKDGEI